MRWRVTYDGSALSNHEMDVRELAPALLAIADVFDAISDVDYGKPGIVSLRVRGSFQTGSFAVELSLAANRLTQVLDFFSSKPLSGAGILLALITAFYDIIRFLRRLRAREVLRVENRSGQLIVVLQDGAELPVEERILRYLLHPRLLPGLEAVVAPLHREGVDQVAFGTDSRVDEVVTKADLPFIRALVPSPESLLVDEVRRMALTVVSVAFREENKRRVSDGERVFYVAVADDAFLDRVNRREETFAKDDILVGDVRIRQHQTVAGLRTEYIMEKVQEHRRADAFTQLQFPWDDPGHQDPSPD